MSYCFIFDDAIILFKLKDLDKTFTDAEKYNYLEEEIKRMEENHGLLSLTDIVWNHTAHSSSWLVNHPEAGYNLINSPHLRPAFELDEAILQFSISLADRKV